MNRSPILEQGKNPIHVVHIVYSFKTGGLENGIVNLINCLPESGYRHSIICLTTHDSKFLERIKNKNVNIYDINKPSGNNPLWLISCWKLLRKLKPDICHTRNLSPLEAQLAAAFAGIKFRIHGEHGWDMNDLGGVNVKYQKVRRFFKMFVHHYIVLSSEANEYLQSKIFVNANKIKQICNGVDIDKFTNKSVNLNENLPFSIEGKLVFGTVGRLAQVKNQTDLVQAFLNIIEENPQQRENLRLIVVGDGELMSNIQKMVNEAKASDIIWLAGLRSDISDMMNLMDVFVLPSLAEGISNTLLEAMASGLPYIATDVGGNADLVFPEHKDSHIVPAGSVEKLAQAMKIYVQTPSLVEVERQKIREHCEKNFSIEKMVNEYHALYQSKFKN